jgi:hypothetical protein
VDSDDVEKTISKLHEMISRSETTLQVMRAEVARLEKLITDSAEKREEREERTTTHTRN